MANTKAETTIKKGFDTVKNTTEKMNENAINFADSLVDETIATGKEWQDVMAKAMKTGTTLFGKQQDFVLDTLEAVKTQYLTGTKRFGKLFSFNIANNKIEKAVAKTTKTVKKETAKVVKKAEATLKVDAVKAAEKVEKKAKIEVVKAKTKVTATKKKATPKKKTAAKAEAPKNNLKVIEGVGPKLESILNEAGIFTFKKLSTMKAEDVKEILLAAGPRYKMHNPTTWAAQAKLAEAGKMVELKAFQNELKGGKK